MIDKIIMWDIRTSHTIAEKLKRTKQFLAYLKTVANQKSFVVILLYFYFLLNVKILVLIELTISISLLTGFLMILKLKVKRIRPKQKEREEHIFDQYSFPSGHAARIGVILAFALLFHQNFVALVVICVWGILVCIERVVSRHHYLLDVIAGIIIGLTISFLLIPLINNFVIRVLLT